LPALLVHEGLDPVAQRFGLALDAAGLGVLLLLNLPEVLQVAGGGAEGELLRDQIVARVAVGDVADLTATADLGHVVQQDDFHRSTLLLGRQIRHQRHRARALDRVRQLALVACAAPRNAARDDLATLADEVPEPAHVLVVEDVDLVSAELADLPPAEPPTLYGLLNCRNGSP